MAGDARIELATKVLEDLKTPVVKMQNKGNKGKTTH